MKKINGFNYGYTFNIFNTLNSIFVYCPVVSVKSLVSIYVGNRIAGEERTWNAFELWVRRVFSK